MTEQDKENIRNYCRNLADNWINGEYNQSYVTIGIDRKWEDKRKNLRNTSFSK